MAVELARAYMQIVPSFAGFQGRVSKELAGVGAAGEKAGTGLATSMSGSLRGRLLSAIPGAGAGVGNAMGGSILSTVRKYAAPIAGVVAGFVSVEAVKKSMEVFEATAASTRSLQRTLGGTAQSVSGFVAAMQLSGVQSDKAGTALRIFSKNVGLAGGDSKKAAKLNAELGFSFKDAHGKVLPMSNLLPKVADRFKTLPDGAQKTALAMQLFGKSGTEMLPFLNKGSAGIAELTTQAQKMGLVLDDTSINIFAASRKSARDFGAALQGVGVSAGQDFTVALDGIVNVGRSALIPVFGAMSRVFVALRPQFIAIGEAGDSIAKKLGAQLAPIVNRLAGEFIAFVQKADIGKWAADVSAGIGRVVSGIGGLTGGGIVSSISGIAQGFSPLRAVLDALAPVLPQIVSALSQAATTIGPVLATVATNVVRFLTPLLTSKQGILDLVGAFVAFKVVSGIFAGIALAQRLFTGAMTALTVVQRIATAAQWLFNVALDANPIGIVVLAIAGLVAGLVWFFTQTKLGQQVWAAFTGFLVQAWNNIVTVAKVVWTAITANITGQINVVRGVITAVVGFIVGYWRTSWTVLTTVVRTVFGAVAGFIGGVVGTISNVIRTGMLLVLGFWILGWRALTTIIAPVLNGIAGIVRGVIGTVRTVIAVGLGVIVGLWRTNWAVLTAIIRVVWGAIVAVVAPVIARVGAVISAGVNGIVTSWRAGWNFLTGIIRAVWNGIVAVVAPVINRLRAVIAAVVAAIVTAWRIEWNIIRTVVTAVWNAVASFVSGAVNRVRSVVVAVVGAIVSFWRSQWNAARTVVSAVWSAISGVVSAGINRARSVISGVLSAISGIWRGAWNAVASFLSAVWGRIGSAVSAGIGRVVAFVRGIGGKVSSAVSGFGNLLVSAGGNLIQGLIKGITGAIGGAISAVSSLASSLPEWVRKILGIHSPSTVFAEIGRNIGAGLIKGLLGTKAQITATANTIANTVTSLFESKKISTSTRTAALAILSRDTKELGVLSERRKTVLGKIAAEQATLQTLKTDRANAATTVRDATTGAFDITKYGSGQAMVGALQTLVANTKTFRTLLARLVKAGIDPVTYGQIVNAGVAGGGLIAAQQLLAQPATIRQIASLQGSLGEQASALGSTTSTHMYNAGVSSAQGLIRGLTTQSNSITKAMEHLATTMVNSLKKKLGIHSPSTVFAGHGDNIAQGLIQGMTRNQGRVGAAASDLIGRATLTTQQQVRLNDSRAHLAAASSKADTPAGPLTLVVQDENGSFLGTFRTVADQRIATAKHHDAVMALAGGRRP